MSKVESLWLFRRENQINHRPSWLCKTCTTQDGVGAGAGVH